MQLRAVRLALERALAMGAFKYFAPLVDVRKLPRFDIAWDPCWLADDAEASCRFEPGGNATVALRSDASPRSLIRSVLHEMQHAGDFEAIANGMPRDYAEHKAYATQMYVGDVLQADRSL
jgi:hypothetical protein